MKRLEQRDIPLCGIQNYEKGIKIHMKSTIVIPNFNGIKYIENCLISLQKCLNFGEFHVIVVDNGSKDGSKDIVANQYPWVELIALEFNTGFCVAANEGIRATMTPYVILLNNDTTVAPDFVLELEKKIEADAKIFSVSAKMVDMKNPSLIDGAGDLYSALGWGFARGKGKHTATDYTEDAQIFSSCGGAAAYRMSILNEIGLLDENHFAYLEDMDLGYRAQIFGYRNYYASKAIVYHAGSAASGSRYNEFKITLSSKNSIYLIYKNMPFLQMLINLPFLMIGYFIKTLFFIKKGYGKTYCKGIVNGLVFCTKPEAKSHKIPFSLRNFKNYVRIQKCLWVNMFLRNM